LSWNDPMPVVRSTLHRLLARHGGAAAESARHRDWFGS
jgi:hypothetical protein